MRKDNRGLSLVEIIIVIAIISVLSGIMTIGVGSVVSRPAQSCAEKVVSVLRNAKVTTMGKRSYEMSFSQADSGSPIMLNEKIFIDTTGSAAVNNTEKIGESGVSFVFYVEDGGSSTAYNLSSVDSLQMGFNRSTGGFLKSKFKYSGTLKEGYISKIVISKGTMTKEITLAYLTGKVSIK